MLAIILFFAAPAFWFVCLGLGLYAIFSSEAAEAIDTTTQRNAYIAAEQRWRTALDAWQGSMGIADAETIFALVNEARAAYTALPGTYKSRVETYKHGRRTKQLTAYLDRFEIRKTKLRGIGPSKLATLASYGIETAADVSHQKVLSVPGFGDATAATLVEWRRKHEARFVYQETMNDADRQEYARILSETNSKASTLRTTILTGRANLANLAARIRSGQGTVDRTLDRIHQELEQAKCDLQFLGVPLPPVPVPPSSPQRTGTSPSRGSITSLPTNRSLSTPTCPRCGSGMVRRTARRGPNAGGPFWGCSRYPGCRGTRNI